MADVHVLDEADGRAGAAEVAGEVENRVLVQAAADDGVELHRSEPGSLRRRDPVEDAPHRHLRVIHAHERGVVERVERNRHAVQAGSGERIRLSGEERRIGGEREVLDARHGGEHRDQPVQLASHERLAAGEAHLRHPVGDERRRQPRDLLEGQDLRARQEGVVRAEGLARHAVGAAEVAAVGDADAQVAQRPGSGVEDGERGGDAHQGSMVPGAAHGPAGARLRRCPPAARR